MKNLFRRAHYLRTQGEKQSLTVENSDVGGITKSSTFNEELSEKAQVQLSPTNQHNQNQLDLYEINACEEKDGSVISKNYEETNLIIVKKKNPFKSIKLLNNLARYMKWAEKKANNQIGEQWDGEQEQRRFFMCLRGEEREEVLQQDNRNNQIIMIEPSTSEDRLRKLRSQGKPFSDNKFKPNKKSLFGHDEQNPNWDPIKWRKISKVYAESKIFVKGIQPLDIKQGFLGDCYFLAGIAAIAEHPQRIHQLFLLKKKNQFNYFSIKMLFKGKWRIIDLDQQIPVVYNQPAFGKSVQKELWVILLEKAWAKLYGSYKHIEAGFAQQSLHDLTGAPIKHIFIKKALQNTQNAQETWDYLMYASKQEYSMVACSNSGSDDDLSPSGIVQGHAYTLLNATVMKVGIKEQRIVQLRNPWGSDQFKGKWCDEDNRWNYISKKQKQRIGYIKNIDDGIFFMGYEDFLKEFKILTTAQIYDDASYIYKSFYDPEGKGAFFRIQILHKGWYSFQIDKTPERMFYGNKQSRYRYPQAFFEIGKLEDSKITKYPGFKTKRRTLYRKFQLEPGIYIAWARICFDPEFQKDFEVTLAIYAQFDCKINLATQQQAMNLKKRNDIDWKGEEVKKQTVDQILFKSSSANLGTIIKKRLATKIQKDVPKDVVKKEQLKTTQKISHEQKVKDPKLGLGMIMDVLKDLPKQQRNSLKNNATKIEKKSQVDNVNTNKSQRVKKVRKIEIKTSKVEVTRMNKFGEKQIKSETIENKTQTLNQHLQQGISKNVIIQEKKTKELETQVNGETLNKVQDFEEIYEKRVERPDGQIIKKVQRNEGKVLLFEEEGEESVIEGICNLKNEEEDQKLFQVHSDLHKISRNRQNFDTNPRLSSQQNSGQKSDSSSYPVSDEESGSLDSQQKKIKKEQLLNIIKTSQDYKKKSKLMLENSDEQAQKEYDAD